MPELTLNSQNGGGISYAEACNAHSKVYNAWLQNYYYPSQFSSRSYSSGAESSSKKSRPDEFHIEPTVFDNGNTYFIDTTGNLGSLRYEKRPNGAWAVAGSSPKILEVIQGRAGASGGFKDLEDGDYFRNLRSHQKKAA